MAKIKVLIVDDSIVYRSQIKAALESMAEVEVAGSASNGKIALEKLTQVPVDLLILDLEMPEMNGIQTLSEINKRGIKVKTLVFSSISKRGSEITMDALKLGASDFVTKPGPGEIAGSNPAEAIKGLLAPKIRALFLKMLELENKKQEIVSPYPKLIWDLISPQVVVIGSSTGGPTALEKLFSNLRGPLNCPILITQHMPPIFTATLAERLAKLSGIEVCEASHGMKVEKNKVYVAPGDYHMRLKGNIGQVEISLDQSEKIHAVRPAVDPLFISAAQIFKDRCLGVVLTGMGYDGRDGCVEIKKNHGAVVIQSEESCVVFGMPGAVKSVGAYDKIEPLEKIIEIIQDKASLATVQKLKVAGVGWK